MDHAHLRQQAALLRQALAAAGVPVRVALSYEALARLHNLSSYNRLLNSPGAALLPAGPARTRALRAALERAEVPSTAAQLETTLETFDPSCSPARPVRADPAPDPASFTPPFLVVGAPGSGKTLRVRPEMTRTALERGAAVLCLQPEGDLNRDLSGRLGLPRGETLHLLLVDADNRYNLQALDQAARNAGLQVQLHRFGGRFDPRAGRCWAVPVAEQPGAERPAGAPPQGAVAAWQQLSRHHPRALLWTDLGALTHPDDRPKLLGLVGTRRPGQQVVLSLQNDRQGEVLWEAQWPELLAAFPARLLLLRGMGQHERRRWLQRHPPLDEALDLLPFPGEDTGVLLSLASDHGTLIRLDDPDDSGTVELHHAVALRRAANRPGGT